jgi:hypothetical protein
LAPLEPAALLGERLADQAGAHRLAVQFDDAAAGLRRESRAADAGDSQRIQDAANEREGAEQDDGGTKSSKHDGSLMA